MPSRCDAFLRCSLSSGRCWRFCPRAQGHRSGGTGYKVTIAARHCPEYTDITANRARNDIQESLEDLGEDTPYTSGQPIDPAIEDANQPNCTPLPNWRFTLGKGYQSRAVSGPWGSLSIVTDPYNTDIVTRAETPLLDANGADTGDTIAGAVTIELTQDQLERAATANSLWLQGGTPSDPILNAVFPGQYGFGALRCAIDNLNGDNVEWISFPQGSEHVFCYAYYVTPPPTSGRIVIRKRVDGGASQVFNFDGNLSFNDGGKFSITLNNQESASTSDFFRAAGETWTAHELVPAGWSLTGISCVTALGSTWDARPRGGGGQHHPGGPRPRDVHVHQRAHSTRRPAIHREDHSRLHRTLQLRHLPQRRRPTIGGGPRAHGGAERARGGAAQPADGQPRDYRIEEQLPTSRAGEWRLRRVFCNAKPVGIRRPRRTTSSVDVTIEPGQGAACTFVNKFVPKGAIVIDKMTVGGTGTAGFTISPVRDPETSYEQSVTTREPGEPRRARGDRTRAAPPG